MRFLFGVWKLFPSLMQNIIKYLIMCRKMSYNQVAPFPIMSLLSGNIHIAKTAKIRPWSNFSGGITIGDYSYIESDCIISASDKNPISIGSFCSIASQVCILAFNDHNYTKLTNYPPEYGQIYIAKTEDLWWSISIWHDVRIGLRSIILPWVNIWHGAVVGAWSVVTKDIPPYAIVWWVPAKIIKYRFDDNTIQKLLDSQRWEWDIEKIRKNYHLEFIDKKEELWSEK